MRRWYVILLSCSALAACGGESTGTIDGGGGGQIDASGGGIDVKVTPDAAQPPDAPPPPPPDARAPIDVLTPDAPPPPPDARPPIDVAPPPIDAVPAPDACPSDPECNGSAGAHCNAAGQTVTCVQAAPGCFQIEGTATDCPDHQTCVAGGTACTCVADPKCTAGAGNYCDPAGSGSFYTCAADANGCVVSAADTACPDPKICTGAAPAGACVCPAVLPPTNATEGAGCAMPDQLACDVGPDGKPNVLICKTVGGCNVWTVQFDCATLSLTCNNNQCVCPPNTSHNFYVGPNYDRSGIPASVTPNGLLTANGICTFPTVGEGLFAAAADVLLTQSPTSRVVAVALGTLGDGVHATFASEQFPIIVGNRTVLTTYEDNDPNVGGTGQDPTHYTIVYNHTFGTFGFSPVAVVVDPLVSSGGQTAAPPIGGSAGFKGYTVQATQANIDCPGNNVTTTTCTDGTVGGARVAVVASGGEIHTDNLRLLGHASDAPAKRAGTVEQVHGLELGLWLVSHARFKRADVNDNGAPWGTFGHTEIRDFGHINSDDTDAFAEQNGAALIVDTGNQGFTPGANPVAHRAVFSHIDIHDSAIGAYHKSGNLTFAGDPNSSVANSIAGTLGTTTVRRADLHNTRPGATTIPISTMAVGMIFGGAVEYFSTCGRAIDDPFIGFGSRYFLANCPADAPVALDDEAFDFQGEGTFVTDAEKIGVLMSSTYTDIILPNTRPAAFPTGTLFLASSAAFTGGEVSGTLYGANVLVRAGGMVVGVATTLPDAFNRQYDPDHDDVIVGGLSLNGTSVTGGGSYGVEVNNAGGSDRIDSVFHATDAIVDGNADNGVFIHRIHDSSEAIHGYFNGGKISNNGTLLDLTPGAPVAVFGPSFGSGVDVEGALFSSTGGTVISGNILAGLVAFDIDCETENDCFISADGTPGNEGSGDYEGTVVLGATSITGNSADLCALNVARATASGNLPITAPNEAFSCRLAAVLVGNWGGFTATGVLINGNNGPGLQVFSAPTNHDLPALQNQTIDDTVRCGASAGNAIGLCPINVFTGGSVSDNGTGDVRADQVPRIEANSFFFASGAGGNTQGVIIDNDAAVLINGGAVISGNKGHGIDAIDGTLFLGDSTVTANGVNSGILVPGTGTAFVAKATPGAGIYLEEPQPFEEDGSFFCGNDGDSCDSGEVGNAQITGSAADGVVISNNAGIGVINHGAMDMLNARVTGNQLDGIEIQTPLSDAEFGGFDDAEIRNIIKNSQVDNNGGHGIHIRQAGDFIPPPEKRPTNTPTDAECTSNFFITGDRPTLRSLMTIHDNADDGLHVGSLDSLEQTGNICVQLGDNDVFANHGKGIFVAMPDDGGIAYTSAVILDNDVFTNGTNGLFAYPSFIGQDASGTDSPTFSQNKFHNNGLNQIVLDGDNVAQGVRWEFDINSPTNLCDAGANAVYCYTAKQVFGIFAQGSSDVFVRHTEFEGGGTGLKDFSAQSGSTISVASNCTAITVCP